MKQVIKFARRNEMIYPIVRWARDLALYARGLRRGTFSQHGEDVWLRERFAGKTGIYVDVGASHPFLLSNTYMLYRDGWRGVTVEPIPDLAALHRRWRPEDNLVEKAVGPTASQLFFHEMFPSVLSTLDQEVAHRAVRDRTAELIRVYSIDVITLDQLLIDYVYNYDLRLDILSIDLEGLDEEVVRSCMFDYVRPQVIVIEFNDQDAKARMFGHLNACGYNFAAELGCNLIVEDVR